MHIARFSHSYQEVGGLERAAGLRESGQQDAAGAWGRWPYLSHLGVSLWRQHMHQGAGSCPCPFQGSPAGLSGSKASRALGALDRKTGMSHACDSLHQKYQDLWCHLYPGELHSKPRPQEKLKSGGDGSGKVSGIRQTWVPCLALFWACRLTSYSPCFLICKMGYLTFLAECPEDKIR